MAKGGKREGAGRKRGVPNKASGDVKAIAQQWGLAAIEKAAELAGLKENADGVVKPAESEQVRLAAAALILDRAYGKSPQAIVGDPNNPVHVKHSRIEFAIVNAKG